MNPARYVRPSPPISRHWNAWFNGCAISVVGIQVNNLRVAGS